MGLRWKSIRVVTVEDDERMRARDATLNQSRRQDSMTGKPRNVLIVTVARVSTTD